MLRLPGHLCGFGFITFYWAGFTVAHRERVQEDFKVPYEGAPPHSPHPFQTRNLVTRVDRMHK